VRLLFNVLSLSVLRFECNCDSEEFSDTRVLKNRREKKEEEEKHKNLSLDSTVKKLKFKLNHTTLSLSFVSSRVIFARAETERFFV